MVWVLRPLAASTVIDLTLSDDESNVQTDNEEEVVIVSHIKSEQSARAWNIDGAGVILIDDDDDSPSDNVAVLKRVGAEVQGLARQDDDDGASQDSNFERNDLTSEDDIMDEDSRAGRSVARLKRTFAERESFHHESSDDVEMMFYNEKRVCDAIPCAHTRNPAPRSRSPRIHSDTSSHSYTVPRTPNVPTPTTSPAPNRSISSTPQPGPPKSFRNSTVRDSEGAGEEEQEMEVEARVSQIECVVDGYSEDESGEEEPGYQLRVEIETKPRSLDSLQSESVSDSESQSEECSLNCRKYSKFCVDLRDESDLDHDEESEDEEDEMEEEEDPLSESEWDEDMKRPTGPRTHRFFGQAYSKFIKRDWRMSSGTHRYDFSRKDGERTFPNQNAPSGGFKEHHLKPGNFVELMWPEEVEDFVTKKYYARVSDVTEHGIRVLQLYFPNQSFLRAAGNMLDQKLLFQSSVCECEHGWIKFSQVLRIVSVFYGNRLEGNAEFFVPFFYCLDNFSFFNVPDAFLDPNSKPRDLCLCPNTRNSDRWPETTEQKKSAHLIGTAMKRQFQPGEFYGFIMPPSSASEPPLDAVIEIISFSRGNAVVNDEENGDDTFYADPPVLRIRMFETLHESSMPNELRWRDNEYELVGWNEIARVSHPVFVEFWDGQAPSQAVRYKGAGSRFFFKNMPEKAQDYPVHGLQRRGLKMIDFFSGAGIFSLGITDSNLGDVATAIDNCEYACKSWNTIHRKNGVCRNMDVNAFLKKASTAARKSEVGRKEYHYDMVVASPPCQDWTILNRYRKESGRSLIVEVGNMIECLPNVDYLLVENVAEWGRARYWKEMGQVDDGDTKTTPYCYLLAELLSFGYQIHSECIDSAHHGSPQSRNRLILNAVIKDKKLTSLPNPSHYFKSTRRQHSSYVKPANACGESQPESRIPLHGPCRFVTVEDTIGDLPPAVRMGFKPKVPLHVFTRDEEEFTIERHERVRRQGQFKTIARNPVPGAPKFHYSFNRQLTLRERALAQGFFKEDIARLHRLYDGKHMTTQSRDLLNVQIGNAVSRQLAFALACSMNATLD